MFLPLVEPAKKPDIDLPNVMFREAVELLRGVVRLKSFRPDQGRNGFPGTKAPVRHAHRLIPKELDRIPIALDGLGDALGALKGRPMSPRQVRCPQGPKLVEALQEDAGVPVFFSANGEHVKERRP